MKKGLTLGAGVAALSMAALPFAGVFATTQTSVTDTITLTVNEGCNMSNTASTTGAGGSYNLGAASAGSAYAEKTASGDSVLTVDCNAVAGWTVKATATALSNTTAGTTSTIPFGAYAEAASVWSAKVTATGGTIATGWDSYAGATANNTTIVSGNSVAGLTVTPSYKAYAAAGQEAGTYSGTITYTFAQNE